MKALVLAAGRGRRLGPRSSERNKCMIPVGGRPLLDAVLDAAAGCEPITEIIIVVGYRAGDIMARYGGAHRGTPVRYVQQTELSGIVGAIASAADALAGDDFMLLLGDEIMAEPRHAELLRVFAEGRLFALCGVIAVDDIALVRRTYSIDLDAAGRVRRLIEKPQQPFNNLLGTGVCVFRNAILSFVAATPVNPMRGEKELADLIQAAIDAGHVVQTAPVCARYVNLNSERELHEIRSWPTPD